jgi:ribosomal protein S18 acetylase RimI-like enzyme
MIRLATEADLAAVEEIVRDAYAAWVGVIGGKPRPMVADYGELIAAGRVWVDDQPDGLIVLVPEEQALLIENVAVRRRAQGRGLGRSLLAFAEERARALTLPAVRLYTNEKMNSNISLYLSLGYLETGRESFSPIHSVVHMRKGLTS